MNVKIHILLIFLLGSLTIQAQQEVILKPGSKSLKTMKNDIGETYIEIKGNVHLQQGNTDIFCDHANFYKEKGILETFGNVRILEGDSIRSNSEKAFYNSTTGLLKLREKVVFRKIGEMTIYTDFLDYNKFTGNAKYYSGGRMIDDDNNLKSEKGYLNRVNGRASFKGNVVVNNDGSILKSDTLQYDMNEKMIYFLAETELVDEDGNVSVFESGKYNTETKVSTLRGGRITSGSYYMEADNIYPDDVNQIYRAEGNVYMKSDSDNVVITGSKAIYNKGTGLTKIFEDAVMRKPTDEGDTLYLSADTLLSLNPEADSLKRLLAYPNVKIFKEDIQGMADSIAYVNADSILYLYRDPILWASGSQISADTLGIRLINNQLNQLKLYTNGFIITQDTIKNFNQLKGRNITTFFQNNAIDKIDVQGNAESLYYVLRDDNSGIQGVNKMTCSNLRVLFRDGKVHTLKTYVDVESYFIPPHELEPEQKKLENFEWRIQDKPTLISIFEKKATSAPENDS